MSRIKKRPPLLNIELANCSLAFQGFCESIKAISSLLLSLVGFSLVGTSSKTKLSSSIPSGIVTFKNSIVLNGSASFILVQLIWTSVCVSPIALVKIALCQSCIERRLALRRCPICSAMTRMVNDCVCAIKACGQATHMRE